MNRVGGASILKVPIHNFGYMVWKFFGTPPILSRARSGQRLIALLHEALKLRPTYEIS